MEPLTLAPVVFDPVDVDQYCIARIEREAAAAREKLHKDKLMACIPPDLAATDRWSFNGDAWVIGVSAREWERTIKSLRALYRRIGHKEFFDRCKFNLKDFDALVPEGERPRFVHSAQTGPRKFALVKKYTSAS